MQLYETAFLIAPNLSEEEAEELTLKMAEVVSKRKGKMIEQDKWGKRRLSYPIKKFEEAYYVFFRYEADPSVPSELERLFKQTEAILRFMTLKKEKEARLRRRARVVRIPEEEKGEESTRGEAPSKDTREEEKLNG